MPAHRLGCSDGIVKLRHEQVLMASGLVLRLLRNQAHPKRLVTAEAIQSEESALRFCEGACLSSDPGRLLLDVLSFSFSRSLPAEATLSLLDWLPVLATTTRLVALRSAEETVHTTCSIGICKRSLGKALLERHAASEVGPTCRPMAILSRSRMSQTEHAGNITPYGKCARHMFCQHQKRRLG